MPKYNFKSFIVKFKSSLKCCHPFKYVVRDIWHILYIYIYIICTIYMVYIIYYNYNLLSIKFIVHSILSIIITLNKILNASKTNIQ